MVKVIFTTPGKYLKYFYFTWKYCLWVENRQQENNHPVQFLDTPDWSLLSSFHHMTDKGCPEISIVPSCNIVLNNNIGKFGGLRNPLRMRFPPRWIPLFLHQLDWTAWLCLKVRGNSCCRVIISCRPLICLIQDKNSYTTHHIFFDFSYQ